MRNELALSVMLLEEVVTLVPALAPSTALEAIHVPRPEMRFSPTTVMGPDLASTLPLMSVPL